MAKTEKKVNVKDLAKMEVMSIVVKALEAQGFTVSDGKAYGFTAGTVIVGTDACDIQLKPVAPKTGITRYEVEVEE